MIHSIDTRKLYIKLAQMQPEERARYILEALLQMEAGTCGEPWFEGRQKKEAAPASYSGSFEEFWGAYPKKTGKGAAFKAWQRVKMDKEDLLGACLRALNWQKKSEQWTRDKGQFIPMPSTYLNQRRWEDEDPDAGRTKEGYLDHDGIWRER